jgi:hypothetical protein
MPKTYEPIATNTVGTATTTVTFSSIPQTYTDIVVASSIQVSGNVNVFMTFNSDTGANYSFTLLQGDGTSASSSRATSQNRIQLDSVAFPPFSGSSFAPGLVHLNNYSNSTTYKTALIRANNAAAGVSLFSGLWRNTAAITTVTFVAGAVNFAVGTTFTLYGIKAA